MKINLWAKKGAVVISIVGDPNPNTAPTLTVEIKDPQIIYDEGENRISVIETK